MFRLSPRAGAALATLAVGATTLAAATLSMAQPPVGGQPPVSAEAEGPKRGDILDFASAQDQWHWLVQAGEEVEVRTSSPDQSPQKLTAAAGLTEIAPVEANLWLLQRQGEQGALLKLARSGGAPSVVLSNLAAPGGLFAAEGRVFWIETQAAPMPGLLGIPAAEARNVVRMLAEDGTVRNLGVMVGGRPASNGDLQGTADRICARLVRMGSTEFYRIDLRQPRMQRIAVETGAQQGIVYDRGWVWTAPSEEASDPMMQRCLRRLEGDGRASTLTDWLPAGGQVMRLGDELFWADVDLHRIPEGNGEPGYVANLPSGKLTTDGKRVILLDAQSGPKSVFPAAPKR